MNKIVYSHPVSKLLTQGDCRRSSKWPDYLELGLTQEHIPELIRMLTDEELIWAPSDSLEVWAPMHAWRALGQLQAVEAIEPLINQLYKIDDEDDDWVGEEFPEVFAMIGPKAISSFALYLGNTENGLFARTCAAESFKKIGNMYPDTRKKCVEILTEQLKKCAQNDPTLNGFLISDLVDLKALESIKTIRQAYQRDCVDYTILGDMEDVEIELGLRTKRSTPPPQFEWVPEREDLPLKESKTVARKKPKIGRNDPCPCGSGKKYKKCCLNKI
jgi:L-rhamnose mutarotase